MNSDTTNGHKHITASNGKLSTSDIREIGRTARCPVWTYQMMKKLLVLQ